MTKVGNIFGFATDCNIFFIFSVKSGIYCVLSRSPLRVRGYFPRYKRGRKQSSLFLL